MIQLAIDDYKLIGAFILVYTLFNLVYDLNSPNIMLNLKATFNTVEEALKRIRLIDVAVNQKHRYVLLN